MTLAATARLFWHCGAHTAKPESAPWGRFLITKICCFLWHVDTGSALAPVRVGVREGGLSLRGLRGAGRGTMPRAWYVHLHY